MPSQRLRAFGHIRPGDVETVFLAIIGIGDGLPLSTFDVVEKQAQLCGCISGFIAFSTARFLRSSATMWLNCQKSSDVTSRAV